MGRGACIAAEADGIIENIRIAVEQERKEKQSENFVNRFSESVACDNKLTEAKRPERTDQKVSEAFNTNRTYVKEAKRNCTTPEIRKPYQ